MPGDIVEVSGKPGLQEKGVPGIQNPYVDGEDEFGGGGGSKKKKKKKPSRAI